MSRFLLLIFLLLVACGGVKTSPKTQVAEAKMTAEDAVSRARLDKAQFTTAVDQRRYRIAAPPLTVFLPTDEIIYMVGKIKKVPTNASIEVRWFLRSDPTPQTVSSVQGSATYQFVASFRPSEDRFRPGAYMARVYVNNREVGARPFAIKEDDYSRQGPLVHELAISAKVTRKMQAKNPNTTFKNNTKKLFVSFEVSNLESDADAEVNWYRDNAPFHSQTITLSGNQRYAAHISSGEGLPGGDYAVEITVDEKVMANRRFVIATDSNEPTINAIALGLELDENNMPVRPLSAFSVDTEIIQCGLSFLDLSPETTLVIQWIKIGSPEEGVEDAVLYMNQLDLPWGGSGTLGANWKPYDIEPGNYKVAVLMGEETMAESPFEIVDSQ
jgi:hypothetical protein